MQSLQLQNDNLTRIVGEITNEMELWRSRYQELEIEHQRTTEAAAQQQSSLNDTSSRNGVSDEQIKTLVADLEQKVQSLIAENERLNQILSDQMRDIENYESVVFSYNQL